MPNNRRNRIKIEDVIKQYVNRNKRKLEQIFGSLASASAHLKYDVPNLPQSVKSYKDASDIFSDYIEEFQYGNEPWFKLKQAKKAAKNNTPGVFDDLRQLNKRIDPNAYQMADVQLAERDDRFTRTLKGFYEIKDSKYILAYVSNQWDDNSEVSDWEFVKKSEVIQKKSEVTQ